MLPALLAISVSHASHSGTHAHFHGASPRLTALVARAWSEADEQADKRHQDDLKSDRELGKKYSEIADKELKLSTDKALIDRVQRVGGELAAIANRDAVSVTWGDKRLNTFEYTFKVVEDKSVNAFSLPGGFIYVYDGLIKYAESDDELAGVLAHEVAHASFRHVATLQREQSKLNAITIPLILISLLAGAARGGGASGGGEALILGQLINTAVGSGWSVRAEQSADYGGLQYMVRSKYDPTGILTFMERLARDERNGPAIDWGIYRTHPPSRDRADALTKYMRQANLPVRRSRVSTTLRADTKPADDGTVKVIFGKREIVALAGPDAIERGDRIAQRLNGFFDSVPEMFELQAGQNGTIVGRRQPIIQLTHEDAVAAKVTVEELQAKTLKALRLALFNVSLRVWDGK